MAAKAEFERVWSLLQAGSATSERLEGLPKSFAVKTASNDAVLLRQAMGALDLSAGPKVARSASDSHSLAVQERLQPCPSNDGGCFGNQAAGADYGPGLLRPAQFPLVYHQGRPFYALPCAQPFRF